MTLTDADREYLLPELDQVRKDYAGFIEETRQLERYAILVTGVTWSWCASHEKSFAFTLLAWFPAVACALFGIRAMALHFQARAAGRYIAKVEHIFKLPGSLGWASDQIQRSKGMPALAAITAYGFWLIVNGGAVVVPIVFHAHTVTEQSRPLPTNTRPKISAEDDGRE